MGGAHREGPGLAAAAAVRAEGRRARRRHRVREGPDAVAGHPRRRPGGRGRHVQRPLHRRHPQGAHRGGRAPGARAGRGSGRGLLPDRGLRRPQRRGHRAGAVAVRQRAQRRRGHPAPAHRQPRERAHHDAGQGLDDRAAPAGRARPRPQAARGPAARGARHRRVAGPRAVLAVRGLRRAAFVGSSDVRPRHRGRVARGRPRLRRPLRRAPARRRARDRRRRGQGRRPRHAGPARLDVPRPALGDRLQVPARGRAHTPARHRGQRRVAPAASRRSQ